MEWGVAPGTHPTVCGSRATASQRTEGPSASAILNTTSSTQKYFFFPVIKKFFLKQCISLIGHAEGSPASSQRISIAISHSRPPVQKYPIVLVVPQDSELESNSDSGHCGISICYSVVLLQKRELVAPQCPEFNGEIVHWLPYICSFTVFISASKWLD